MAEADTAIRPRGLGERLGAAAVFLTIPFTLPVAIIAGFLLLALLRQRRPFAAAAGAQAASWQLLFNLLGVLLFGISALAIGTAATVAWVLDAHRLLLETPPTAWGAAWTAIPGPQQPFAAILLALMAANLLAALAGAAMSLAGRLFPLPLPPRRLREWVK